MTKDELVKALEKRAEMHKKKMKCAKGKCPICNGAREMERTDGIDYNRKIAVPEHKAGQTGG